MKKQSNFKPILRAVSVMGIIMVIVSGVTFAALQSQQAVLSGNTIESATADLKVSTDGTTYTSSHTGFDFPGVVPGGPAVPAAGNSFYLKNSGTTASQVKLAISTTPTNLSSVDLAKVSVIITHVPGGTSQTFTLASLLASYADGGTALIDTLPASTAYQYKIQISMAADAFTGSGASLGNIDFVFIGIAQ
ncbi:MAG: hypothetical protein JWO47_34 [Candidatus Saccharibacteria bacterium]|nr:hypothetical protein [Candidatus Saccharibacteria bacterium]